MKPTTSDVKKFFTDSSTNFSVWLFPIATSFLCGIFIRWPEQKFLLWASSSMMFTMFDVIGFRIGVQMSTDPNANHVISYRIMQQLYQHTLGILLLFIDPYVCISYYTFWITGGNDLMYYIIDKENYYDWKDNFTWLSFTIPFGVLSSLFKFKITPRMLQIGGAIGAAASIILLWLF